MSREISNNSNSEKNFLYKSKLEIFFSKPILVLPIIALVGLLVRFFIFPYEVPFKLDSLDIFSYAVLSNNPTRIFSLTFTLMHLNNYFTFRLM